MTDISPRHQVQPHHHQPGEEVGRIMPPARILAQRQHEAVTGYLDREVVNEPTWFAMALDHELGQLLEGDLWAVGATQKAGKTTFLLSQLEHLASQGRRVLYFPLEMTPLQARLRWAAARLAYPWDAVISRRWDDLQDGARDRLKAESDALARKPVQFPPDKSPTIEELTPWVTWAIKEYRAEVVFVDHFHRLDVGGNAHNYRVAASKAVRELKNLALETGVRMVVAAQFNRAQHDRLDLVRVPDRGRFKETNAINEEADVCIGLSRIMRKDVTKDDLKAVREGDATVFTVAEPNTMRVTVLDHRRRNMADVQPVLLTVSEFARDPHYGERGYRSRFWNNPNPEGMS